MKKFFKILAAVIGGLIVLVVAAIIVLPMVVNPNDYKPQIAALVKKDTGRELTIPGKLELTVFPWLGVKTGTVELGNPPGFAQKVFARTEGVSVRLRVLPLLEHRIEMDKVTVRGLALHLARNRQGQTNWEGLMARGKKGAPESGAPGGGAKAPAPEAGAPQIAGLAIGGLDIRNASLTWDDAQQNQHFKLANLDLQSGPIAAGKPVDVKLQFDAEGGKPQMSGHFAFGATLEAGPNGERFQARGLHMAATLSGGALPAKVSADLGGNLAADLARQNFTIEDLKLRLQDLQASGRLAVSDFRQAPKLSGTLDVAQFNPRALLQALGASPPRTADPKALTTASLAATLSGTPDSVRIDPLRVRLDDTHLDGSVALAHASGTALRFDLKADTLDVDRYLPPPAPKGAAASGTSTAGTAPPAPKGTTAPAAKGAATPAALPLAALRDLNAAGTLHLGKLRAAKLDLQDVAVTVAAKNGVIRLNPIVAKLYDGSFRGDVAVDARGPQPRLALDEKLAGVQIGALLKDLQGQDRLTGTANLTAKLDAAGANADEVKRTLTGNSAFSVTNGALKGINIAQTIREAKAKLTGATLPASTAPPQTDFTELTGTLHFKNGIATNEDMSAKSPLLRIEGRGSADLPKDTLDYHLKATVVATTAGQGGAELKDLAGIPIPLHITGSLAQPKYGLDLQALAQAVAKSKAGAVVEQQKQEAQQKLQEKLKDLGGQKTQDLLKGVFQ